LLDLYAYNPSYHRNLSHYGYSIKVCEIKGWWMNTFELGLELKTWCLLGRFFTAWATNSALFSVVIFEVGPCFLPRPAWTTMLLF
jgi:hypothetical protein